MDDLFNEALPPLSPYRDRRFRIEEMTLAINAIDWQAVMSSRESLRLWSESAWPEDSFSLEENAADIEQHRQDHLQRQIYGYTILSPDADSCLGSIYIRPISAVERHWLVEPELAAALSPYVARLDFWLRDSERLSRGEEALLSALRLWIGQQWRAEVVYASRPAMSARRTAYTEAGMIQLARLRSRSTDQELYLHGWPLQS